jgi:hypothetical protein
MGSLTRPQKTCSAPTASSPEAELIQPLILLLLVADVGPYRLSSRPTVLTKYPLT